MVWKNLHLELTNKRKMSDPENRDIRLIDWKNVEELLKLSKRECSGELQIMQARASIEKKYADHLHNWAKMITDHMDAESRNTDDMDYITEALLELRNQAQYESEHHLAVFNQLNSQSGPLTELKKLYEAYNKTTKFGRNTKCSLDSDISSYLKKRHREVNDDIKGDVENLVQAEKEFKKMKQGYHTKLKKLRTGHTKLSPESCSLLKQKIINLDGRAEVAHSKHDLNIKKLDKTLDCYNKEFELYLNEITLANLKLLDTIKRQLMIFVDRLSPSNAYIQQSRGYLGRVQDRLRLFDPRKMSRLWTNDLIYIITIPSELNTIDKIGDSQPETDINITSSIQVELTKELKDELDRIFITDRTPTGKNSASRKITVLKKEKNVEPEKDNNCDEKNKKLSNQVKLSSIKTTQNIVGTITDAQLKKPDYSNYVENINEKMTDASYIERSEQKKFTKEAQKMSQTVSQILTAEVAREVAAHAAQVEEVYQKSPETVNESPENGNNDLIRNQNEDINSVSRVETLGNVRLAWPDDSSYLDSARRVHACKIPDNQNVQQKTTSIIKPFVRESDSTDSEDEFYSKEYNLRRYCSDMKNWTTQSDLSKDKIMN